MTHKKSFKLLILAGVSAIIMTACSGSDYTPPPTPPPPPPPAQTPQDQAGAGFAAAFNQTKTDEPTDPVQNDIIALDKTGEPIEIPDP